MSILRKKTHRTLDVFYLHMDGLFSIKIKVSFNAEIFLMRYRLIHDWLLILTPKELSDVILETKIKESRINLTSREKITQAKFKQLLILYSTNEVIII